MNKTIQDTSDLLRKRRNIPCSALGVWKLNNSLRKEQIFFQPSLSGELSFPFISFLLLLVCHFNDFISNLGVCL